MFPSKLRHHARGRTFNSFHIQPGDVQTDPPQKIQTLAMDIGSLTVGMIMPKNCCFGSNWSHEKHNVLICLKGCSKPFQNKQLFTVIQAILGPMPFTQINGLSRSETVVHVFSRLFHVFFTLCVGPHVDLRSHSCLPIGNPIPLAHWLPSQEERVHDSHARHHTLQVSM